MFTHRRKNIGEAKVGLTKQHSRVPPFIEKLRDRGYQRSAKLQLSVVIASEAKQSPTGRIPKKEVAGRKNSSGSASTKKVCHGCDLRAMWRPKVAAAPSRYSGGSQASATFRAFQHSLSC